MDAGCGELKQVAERAAAYTSQYPLLPANIQTTLPTSYIIKCLARRRMTSCVYKFVLNAVFIIQLVKAYRTCYWSLQIMYIM